MKSKRNTQGKEVNLRKSISLAKMTPILVLGLSIFTLVVIFQPSSEPFSVKEHHLVLKKENPLNPRSLMLTVDESIPGIKSTRNLDTTLEIPFFTKTRFLITQSYQPFLGGQKEIITLKAVDKYRYVTVKRSIISKYFNSNLVYLTVLLLLGFIYWSYRKFNLLVKIFLALIAPLLLVLLQISLVTSLILLVLIILIPKMKGNKFLTLSLILVILLPLLVVSNNKKFNPTLLVKNSKAIAAAKFIKDAKSVPLAIKKLENSYTKNKIFDLESCHPAMHELGMLAYVKLRDSTAALENATMGCEYGYLHGVMDAISLLTTDVNLSKNLYLKGCNIFYNGKNTNSYQECVHGSGHAFFELYDGEINKSIKACKIWPQDSGICMEAVFMSAGDYHQFEKDKFFLPNLCLDLNDKLVKTSCILIAMRYAIFDPNNLDLQLKQSVLYCDSVSVTYQDNCFQAVGNAIGFTMKNNLAMLTPAWVKAKCSITGKIQLACYGRLIYSSAYYHTLLGIKFSPTYYCNGYEIPVEECLMNTNKEIARLKS